MKILPLSIQFIHAESECLSVVATASAAAVCLLELDC
jgi:hypothetical protein